MCRKDAKVLRDAVRAADIVGRIGGDSSRARRRTPASEAGV